MWLSWTLSIEIRCPTYRTKIHNIIISIDKHKINLLSLLSDGLQCDLPGGTIWWPKGQGLISIYRPFFRVWMFPFWRYGRVFGAFMLKQSPVTKEINPGSVKSRIVTILHIFGHLEEYHLVSEQVFEIVNDHRNNDAILQSAHVSLHHAFIIPCMYTCVSLEKDILCITNGPGV